MICQFCLPPSILLLVNVICGCLASDLSIKNIFFCHFVKMNEGTNTSDNAVWCAEGWLAWPSVRCSMDIKWLTVKLAAAEENKLETTDNVLNYHPRQGVLMEELGCLLSMDWEWAVIQMRFTHWPLLREENGWCSTFSWKPL